MRLFFLTTLLTFICLPTWESSAEAQTVQSYQRRFIGDIGYAAVDRRGNRLVVMNPSACRRLGPDLCTFFRAHEMAHHQLGHFSRNISVQQKEAEADRYAASVVSPAAQNAAQQFFASGRGGSWRHGSSQQRMARVSAPQQSETQAAVAGTAATDTTTETVKSSPTRERLGATHSLRRNWVPFIRLGRCR